MYTPASAANNFIATNEGKCVTYGTGAEAVAKCNCAKGALNPTLNPPRMVGQISLMDEPMVSDLSYEKQFTTVTYASAGGGAMFAISESNCKDDADCVVCSGRGQCLADGSCNCNDGSGGPTCENVCPLATDEDEALFSRYGLDENIAGEKCAGHGTCDPITAECICDPGFFGTRCTYICRRDANLKVCSGNGTCVYNPETSSSPYCECDRFQNPAECAQRGLQLYPQGWCSFHGGGATGDITSCFVAGVCGDCASPAAGRFDSPLVLVLLFAAVVVFVFGDDSHRDGIA